MLETVIAEKGIGPKQPPPPPGTPTHPTANQRIKGIFVKSPTVDKALPTTTALLAPVTTPTTGTNGSTREGGAGRQNNASRVMSPPPSAALPSYIPAKAVATSETDLSPNPAAVRQEPVVANTVEQSAALVRDHESAGIPSAGFGFMASPLPQLPPPPPPTPSTAARTGAELGYTDPFA
jgi:hypothetical protein